MEIFGIKFAPLNVPFRRRLQTLSAGFWIVSLVFGNFGCIWLIAYCILFTRYYPAALGYLIWAYKDRHTPYTGGRKLSFIRNLPIWKHFIDYFPIKLVKTAELPSDTNYLFCVFPHGIASAGVFGNFGNSYSEFPQLFPGLDVSCATLDVYFKVPLHRDYIMGFGAIAPSKESISYQLSQEGQRGQVVVLVVGGAAEALHARPGPNHSIVLMRRKGFVQLALTIGTPLVPVFSFGENYVYDQVTLPPGSLLCRIQSVVRDLTGFVPLVPKGRGLWQYTFGILPRRYPITTVVGEPIHVPKINHPSEEEIDKYHSLFMDKLKQLFHREKHNYMSDWEEAELVFV